MAGENTKACKSEVCFVVDCRVRELAIELEFFCLYELYVYKCIVDPTRNPELVYSSLKMWQYFVYDTAKSVVKNF
jgi:hypothetical protein